MKRNKVNLELWKKNESRKRRANVKIKKTRTIRGTEKGGEEELRKRKERKDWMSEWMTEMKKNLEKINREVWIRSKGKMEWEIEEK